MTGHSNGYIRSHEEQQNAVPLKQGMAFDEG
jgi:hypothetical protein